jgi:DNA polymerase (family X)
MLIHNAEIASALDEIADVLEIEGADPFRIRAYRNAAQLIGRYGREVAAMLQAGEDLTSLPGIGADLAGKIAEIAATGRSAFLEELHAQVPESLSALLKLPGLGPKRVAILHQQLGINALEQLHRAALDGCLRTLRGFSEKRERDILDALETMRVTSGRFKLVTAAEYVDPLLAYLKTTPGASRVIAAGSFRRCRETVGDIDILATAPVSDPIMRQFRAYEEVRDVLAAGPSRSTVILRPGLQVDLRVVPEDSYGAALHYFTGSKAHNIAIRRLGQEHDLKINEYGVFRGEEWVAGETEESVFAAVGLPWIPPELREDRGEIEAARAGRLPKLVTCEDLRGDLHVRTTATDGHNTICEMADAARALGLDYIAVAEPSRSVTVARGLTPDRLLSQLEEIDRLNEQKLGILLLKGIEVDILEDGSLGLPDDVLSRLDLVIGAIHSRFALSRAKQTERILRAMDHPHFTILAHPSGRLISDRKPYDVNMPQIIQHAAVRGCYLELNAHPERLDLLDIYCQEAKRAGVLISINSDANSAHGFANLRFGVGQARRGWLEATDVLNAQPLSELRKLLRATM